jgi:Mg-chelatase subunit ChlD
MQLISRFSKDVSGNIGMIFSLATIPAVMMIGAGIDYGRELTARAKLQNAIDEAALSIAQDTSQRSDGELQAWASAMITSSMRVSGAPTNIIVSLHTINGEVKIDASATVEASVGRIFGNESNKIHSTASVRKRTGLKTDIYLLLDNSASMGLAATPQGRDKLYSLTGCAFACHTPEGGQTISNLQVAQNNGILTRLDVLRTSVTTLLSRIDAGRSPLDTIRVGITSFDDNPVLQTPITTDLTQARQYIQNYQLGGNTLFSSAMPTFGSEVGTSGDGTSSARKFALLVTDGVQGKRDRSIGFQPFDATLCDQLKSRGVTMIVLNTEYLPMLNEQPYRDTVMPIQDKLAPALQACATPGFYFSALNQSDIEKAFDQIFTSLTAQIFLTR